MGRAVGGEGDYSIYSHSSSTPDGRSRGEVGVQEGRVGQSHAHGIVFWVF